MSVYTKLLKYQISNFIYFAIKMHLPTRMAFTNLFPAIIYIVTLDFM